MTPPKYRYPELTPSRSRADQEQTRSGHRKQTPTLKAESDPLIATENNKISLHGYFEYLRGVQTGGKKTKRVFGF